VIGKKLENVEYFNYLGSIITNNARWTLKLNPGLTWQKQHSTGRKLFSSVNWTFKEETSKVLRLGHNFVWC